MEPPHPGGHRRGHPVLRAAIAEDAGYALAYTGLADSYALQIDYRGAPVREGMERARAEARKAIELDETLAEAHTSLAWVTFIYDWDWPAAAASSSAGRSSSTRRYSVARQWHSWFLIAMGRTEAGARRGADRRRAGSGLGLDPAEHGLAALLRPPAASRRWSSSAAPWR